MGIIVNKENDKNNELSRRIDADLKAKLSGNSRSDDDEVPDFAEDSEYVRDFKKTGRFSWAWIVLIGFAMVALIAIVFS